MLVLASASAWAKPVSLVVGGKAIFLHTTPVIDDDEVFVPLTALRAIGASAKEDGAARGGEQKLDVTSASGNKFSCKARIIDGNPMLPVRDIAEELGAFVVWDKEKNTLSIRAKLEKVEFDGVRLKVRTSFPLGYDLVESSWTRSEKKLILDIPGLQVPRSADDLVENATKIPIRLGMRDEETTRLVFDLPFTVKARKEGPARTKEVTISVSPSLKDAPAPERVADPQEGMNMPDEKPKPVAAPPAEISGIGYQDRGSKRIDVTIDANAAAKYTTYMLREPDRFVIELANARLIADPVERDIRHAIATGMRMSQFNADTVRVVLDLTRPVAFDVRQEKSGKLTISLELPRGAGGSLAGKTIVLDPGHGGSETGANANGCQEKNLNLAVALRAEKLLKDAGAIVLMTRKTDKTVALKERPLFANRHSADLFISIHHNAMGSANKVSGTETFYHGNDASSRALAHCLQSEIVAAAKLPDRKVKSDYQRYPGSGFAVLRGSTMPAALVEVAFLDHAGDAACARDGNFQQKVAEAITRGIRIYIEGNPNPPPRRPVTKVGGPAEEKPRPKPEEKPEQKPEPKPSTRIETPRDTSPAAHEQAGPDNDSESDSLVPKGRVK